MLTKYLYLLVIVLVTCSIPTESYNSVDEFPISKDNLWLEYSPKSSVFKIWSPAAQVVTLHLYDEGTGGNPFDSKKLDRRENGLWKIEVDGDLNGKYYTFQILHNDQLLEETPGIYAKAVGVNGERAMVLDMSSTNPDGWATDSGPKIEVRSEAIIYELHIRDLTIHPNANSSYPGKYLGLIEEGVTGPKGVKTAIDHIRELGVTHVHLLPTYDHYSIDETKLDSPQFNWGYDPQNYHVPEGSFSTDPYNAEVRIKEFKQMVKAFHANGIGVILDVVYNHTGRTADSNFNLENPDYYYRKREDGSFSDASACGNETASDRPMMRKFILESVKHWMKEYHIDGFRFDLMGIHDIETMNQVANLVNSINPNAFVYGEGWTAGDSPLPIEERALKAHTHRMPHISAFSDDLRDGLKGSVFEEKDSGFVSGKKGMEESIKFGVVGSIYHRQVDYEKVIYSDSAWTIHPWQAVSYVSCHDNQTNYDKLKISTEDTKNLKAMAKLTNAIVLTSQGLGFIHAGSEILRTKKGEHNSYKSPDSVNQFDWNRKVEHADVFEYYKNLIALRKDHPAFRMKTGDEVRNNLEFKRVEDGVVSYQISDANGDIWKDIMVIYNARTESLPYNLKGNWQIAVQGDKFNSAENVSGTIDVPKISMMVLYRR